MKNVLKLAAISLCYVILCLFSDRNVGPMLSVFTICAEGFILAGFLNLAHECIHGHFYKSRKLTNAVGEFSAGLHLTSYQRYKDDHLQHHKHLGTDNDSEDSGSFGSFKEYIVSMLSLGFVRKSVRKLFVEAFHAIKDGNPSHFLSRNWVPTLFLTCVAILLVLHPVTLIRHYLLPLVFANLWIFLLGLPEHYDCACNKDWTANARSVKSNFLVRFFHWGANWHAFHHRYPGTPSPQLPKRHPELFATLQYQENSYALWHLKLIKELLKK